MNHSPLSFWRQMPTGPAKRLAGVALGIFAASVASAQVIEIGDDGAVTRHDGPALYLTADLRPRPIGQADAPAVRAAPVPIETLLASAAAAHGISGALARAVAWHESRFRSDAVSAKGAIGVMQLMPATARFLRVDPYDPAANIEGGVTFLATMLKRYDGDLARTLAAYNAGPAAVDRYGGVPPFEETRAYVAAILQRLSVSAAR